jgi:hypothetical protein
MSKFFAHFLKLQIQPPGRGIHEILRILENLITIPVTPRFAYNPVLEF